ncbi:MAG: DMT family transporter [Ilumatobacteraceae bacterium]
MSTSSFLLVLAAAILHASWNAVVKAGVDRLVTTWAIVTMAAVVNLPILAVAGLPRREVWWVIGVTIIAHVAYELLLVAAYERVDLSIAYPIARGTAPVVTTVAGVMLLGDRLPAVGLIGIAMVTTGLVVAATGRTLTHTQWAFATGLMIATYTVIDGYGVRKNGDAVSFIGTSFILHAILLSVIVVIRRDRSTLVSAISANPGTLLFAGAANAGAYLFVMIAARVEPLGLVSGLRETSTLFGLLFASRFLGEHVTRRQTIAIAVAAAGAIAIALA